jgi:Na+(H+)/acetate symporter ActP
VSSLTVAVYVFLGGLLSAIFNEVLQFVLIWLGALLIPILGLMEAGGWNGTVHRISANLTGDYTHLWRTLGSFQDNLMGIHWTGIVLGLGWVISFDYRFPGRAEGAFGAQSARRLHGAHHRRGIQNYGAVHCDSPGTLGHGAASGETRGRIGGRGHGRAQL